MKFRQGKMLTVKQLREAAARSAIIYVTLQHPDSTEHSTRGLAVVNELNKSEITLAPIMNRTMGRAIDFDFEQELSLPDNEQASFTDDDGVTTEFFEAQQIAKKAPTVVLEQIARRLNGILTCDLSKVEEEIANELIAAGYLSTDKHGQLKRVR